jgi:hypothetical protein
VGYSVTNELMPGYGGGRHVPAKAYELLRRLGVHQLDDPWIWITTGGPVSPDRAQFHIEDSRAPRVIGLPSESLKEWGGYEFNLIGMRCEIECATPRLHLNWWGDDLALDFRYVFIRWHHLTVREDGERFARPSVLYVEYVAPKFGSPDAAIHGLHHHYPGDENGEQHRAELEYAWKGLNLLFKLMGPGGRHAGDGTRWLSDGEALADIDDQILRGKRSATAVAVALGVDPSAIYRRVRKGARMKWAPYVQRVSSRDFAQH